MGLWVPPPTPTFFFQFNHFKCTIQWHQVMFACCPTITVISRTFHHLKQKLPLVSCDSPSQPPATSNLLLVAMKLLFLGTSCKWNFRVSVLLCLAYFTWYIIVRVHVCCSMYQSVFPICG